jgi:class 3 adenylate cyclase
MSKDGCTVLEGERKQITALFADVKGSMELAERLRGEGADRRRLLAEAEQLFAAMGATGEAERVAKELADALCPAVA